MHIRLTVILLCFSLAIFSQTREEQLYLAKADSLIQVQDVDSCIYYLSLVESEDPSVLFRKNVLDILMSDESEEKVIETMDTIIAKTSNLPFSNLIKIAYITYYTELMIPDDAKNTYNLSVINKAIKLHELSEEKDSLQLMHLLHNKGTILHELGRNLEAVDALEKALFIAQNNETRIKSMEGVIYFNLSNAYSGLHQFQHSYELIEKSEAALAKLEHPNLDYLQVVYLDLFSTSLDFGYLNKAQNFLNKSARLYYDNIKALTNNEPTEMAKREIALLYNYMRLYSNTKELEKGKEILKEADLKFSHYKDDYFRLRLAAIYNYMGEMYVIESPKESFQYYQKAIDIFDKKEDLAYGLMFQFNLSKAHLNSKNYNKTFELANDIIQKAESINDYRLPYFYFLEAKAHLEQGLFEESLPRIHQMVDFLNKSEVEIDLVTQKGVNEFLPNGELSTGYLISSVAQTIEEHIPDSRSSHLVMNSLYHISIIVFQSKFSQAVFNEKSQEEYEIMLEGLLKTDAYLGQQRLSNNELIRFSENARSRHLWEKFKFKHEGLDLVDPNILADIQELHSEITELKLGRYPLDSAEVAAEIFEKELELDRLELEKKNKYHSFYRYEDFDFNFNDFQSKLSEDQLVLKYEFLDSVLYVYEIERNRISIRPIDSLQNINRIVQNYVQLLRSPKSNIDQLNSLGEKLYNRLLPQQLKPELLVVSDKILNYLPFELLRRNDKYLLENCIVSNATSLSILDLASSDNKIRNTMIMAPSYDQYILNDQQLAVRGAAYNLEGALAEAEAISKIIPSKKFSRADASKEVFINQAHDFDLLHLSMHSFMNDEDPELSSLVFYDGKTNNELFISELYGLNLNAKLAVLSACNTGVGKEKTGEGMVSVNRAFTYAGVPAIVSSLWSAPDKATQELMTTFYSELKKGKGKAEALRNAKLQYIENQEIEALKHPFFWGSFILHGNTEPLNFVYKNQNIRITAILGILIFLIGFYIGRKKLTSSKRQ